MHPLDIIKQIDSAKSAKDKSDIIIANKNNTKLMSVVLYALDTSMTFHTKKLEFIPPVASLFSTSQSAEQSFDSFCQMLHKLNAKGSCDGNDQMWLNECYSALSVPDRVLCEMVINRSIPCGAGLSKWREGFGENFLPDFPCYLSSAFDEDKINQYIFGHGTKKAFSDVKSDGQRCMAKVMAVHEDVHVNLHSRNGKKYIGLSNLEFELGMMLSNLDAMRGIDQELYDYLQGGYVIDGELVIIDDNGNVEDRSTGNGKISKFIKGKGAGDVEPTVAFIVWDIVSMAEFNGITPPQMPYYNRRKALHNYVNMWCGEDHGNVGRIILQDSVLVDDISGAMDHYAACIAKEEEGTILKAYAGLFDPCPNKKRPNSQFKFKEEFESEFKIVGWYKGDPKKKYANAIGGFIIESACGKVRSNCGGGLSDEERFSDPEQYMGMIMTAKFNALSSAKGRDTMSLTHPRKEMFRTDKTEADTLERILEQIEATRQMRKVMAKK